MVMGACILSALFLPDILTTRIILSCGRVEYNPFMAGIVRNPIVCVPAKNYATGNEGGCGCSD